MKRLLMRPVMYAIAVIIGPIYAVPIGGIMWLFLINMVPEVDATIVSIVFGLLVWFIATKHFTDRAYRQYRIWYGGKR